VSDQVQPKIGVALGSGASRGWSHIGILKALARAGVNPDIVCGTSVGAMIGASYVAGNLDRLEAWVMDATQLDVFKFFEVQLSGSGFVNIDRLRHFLNDYIVDQAMKIEDLPKPFAAVATDVNSGREVWFTDGNAGEAVRASMAMPALFPTVRIDDRWLVDGGLVNPVPVSVCRALGAELVIAVNLNADIIGKWVRKTGNETGDDEKTKPGGEENGLLGRLRQSAKNYSDSLFKRDEDPDPGLFDVVAKSINIFQDRITRSRMAGDPADIVIAPKLAHIGLLDFHRAGEAIEEGERRVERVIDDIHRLLGEDHD